MTRPGMVTVHETRFLEDDVIDRAINNAETVTTVHDELTAREAADIIRREGLTFAATGNDWAADPDGSYISNYATGERVERSAHLAGFPDRAAVAIMAAVG